MCKLIISLFPSLNNLFVTLFLCDKSTFVVLCNKIYSILCLFDQCRFLLRYCHIRNRYGHSSSCRVLITHCFNIIQNFCCGCSTMDVDNFLKDLFQTFFTNMEIYFQYQIIFRFASIYKSKILWQDFIEDETSKCRLNSSCLLCAIRHFLCHTYMDSGM